ERRVLPRRRVELPRLAQRRLGAGPVVAAVELAPDEVAGEEQAQPAPRDRRARLDRDRPPRLLARRLAVAQPEEREAELEQVEPVLRVERDERAVLLHGVGHAPLGERGERAALEADDQRLAAAEAREGLVDLVHLGGREAPPVAG